MNLFSIYLVVQFVFGAALLWACRASRPRGEPPHQELPVPNTIIWMRGGFWFGMIGGWGTYTLARDFGRGHPGWDIAILALGEVLVFVTGFLWSVFFTKATWPTGIAAVASGLSWLAFIGILANAMR